MQIQKCIPFNGHDVFLTPATTGDFLIYAPTLRRLLKVSDKLALSISNYGLARETSDKDALAVISLLGQSLKNAIEPFPIHKRKSNYFHLALGLTKDCTLGCLYCHADAGRKEEMPPDLLQKSARYAFETARNNSLKGVNVSFAVGGEPTTNWALLTACVQELKALEAQHGIPVYLSMTTNGYYGQNKRQFIAERVQSVLLSLDGMPEIQNLHRPTIHGGETYPVVRDTARYFIENVRSFAIRATVSNHSVRKMPEIVEYFFREFGNKYHLVFEPLVPLGRANYMMAQLSGPKQDEFVDYYIQAKELGQSLGIEIRTSAANHRRLVTAFCGSMSIPSFTVTAKGVVTTCERDSEGSEYGYGKFQPESGDFVFDARKMENNKAYLQMPDKCLDCFCKWHCAGDCPDVRNVNYDRCRVNRRLIQYELEALLQGTGRK